MPQKTNHFVKLLMSNMGLDQRVLDHASGPSLVQSSTSLFYLYSSYLGVAQEFQMKCREFDEMDEQSLDSSTFLDKVSQEASLKNRDMQRVLWVSSENDKIKEIAENMIKRLELETRARYYCRFIAKYGRFIVRPIVLDDSKPRISIIDDDLSNDLKPHDERFYRAVETVYGPLGEWRGFRYQNDDHPFHRFVEFKIGHTKWGQSLLDGARYHWRGLNILEKALELFRIARSPQTTIYRVPTSSVDPLSILRTLKLYRSMIEQQTKRQSGDNSEYRHAQPPTPLQSIFWPQTAEGPQGGVDIHQSPGDIRAITDIEYKRNKFLRKLGMPKDEEYSAEKNLSQSNVDLANSVREVQSAYLQGVDRLLQIELTLHGIEVRDDLYELHMYNPSEIEETLRLEKIQLGLDVSKQLFGIGDQLFGQPPAVQQLEEAIELPGTSKSADVTQKDPAGKPTIHKGTLWRKFVISEMLAPYFGNMLDDFDEFIVKQAEDLKKDKKKEEQAPMVRRMQEHTIHPRLHYKEIEIDQYILRKQLSESFEKKA
jgi:hypothetical protein